MTVFRFSLAHLSIRRSMRPKTPAWRLDRGVQERSRNEPKESLLGFMATCARTSSRGGGLNEPREAGPAPISGADRSAGSRSRRRRHEEASIDAVGMEWDSVRRPGERPRGCRKFDSPTLEIAEETRFIGGSATMFSGVVRWRSLAWKERGLARGPSHSEMQVPRPMTFMPVRPPCGGRRPRKRSMLNEPAANGRRTGVRRAGTRESPGN